MNIKALSAALSYIDSWLEYHYKYGDIPGFVVAVAHKEKILFNKPYGYANLEKKEKLTSKHIFRVASQSKTFTAMAIMQLAEKNKLSIDDHIVKYLPWLKEHQDKRFLKITIRQLMSHGAGIIRDGLNKDFWQLRTSFPDIDQFKQAVLESTLVLDTNIRFKYSNFGYGLLGLVIESVSGLSYNDYVKKQIIGILGIKNTGPEYVDQIKTKLVTGYSRADSNKKRLPINDIDTKALSPATGFYSSAEDLCKYYSLHFIGVPKLLNDESKKEMQRTQWIVTNSQLQDEYALGLIVDHIHKRRLFGHAGGFPGQMTKTICDAKDQIVITILTNAIDTDVISISKGVFSIINYFQNSYSPNYTHLEKFQGRFMSLWKTIDIVQSAKSLIAVNPATWFPFTDTEEWEQIDKSTFKIIKTNGFSSEGELVKFAFDKNGKVKSINYAGGPMWPEAIYSKMLAKQTSINTKSFKSNKLR